jgi:hypothetical protein
VAKSIVVTFAGAESSFALEKLDRAKLYGRRERRSLDPLGRRCERAELTRDGALLVRSGMTAQGYFDEGGEWIPNRDLVGLDRQGQPLAQVPSTLGIAQPLIGPLAAEEVLDLAVRTVYLLEPDQIDDALAEQLRGGHAFRCAFNYRADYKAETAVLVGNETGFFALVGCVIEPTWSSLETVARESFDDADSEDEELDFEMF